MVCRRCLVDRAVAGFLNPETPIEARAMLFNFIMNAVLAVIVTGAGIAAFTTAQFPPGSH